MSERLDNCGVGLWVECRGEGPDVLFVHGLSGNHIIWNWLISELESSYRCWTVELRGHGNSDRAPGTYTVDNYAGDIASVLDHIGQPTVVVGHSLGALSAAHLGTKGHQHLRAVYLADPPLFLGDRDAWNSTTFAQAFPILHQTVSAYQAENRPVDDYADFLSAAPSLAGGTMGDHMIPWQLRGHATGLSQMDPACWETAIDGTLFDGFPGDPAIGCPVRVVIADPTLGPAFLPGDDDKLRQGTPHADFIVIAGVGHGLHMYTGFDQPVLADLSAFLDKHALALADTSR